ncbi:XkdX family protein [Desulfosporosinus sp. SB140]
MNWVQIVTQYYQSGFYTTDQVKVFVAKGKITATDYKNITGTDYAA